MHCSSPYIFNGASPKLWDKVTWALYTTHYCVSGNINALNLHSDMKLVVMFLGLMAVVCHCVSVCQRVSVCHYVTVCHCVSVCQRVSVCHYVTVCHCVSMCVSVSLYVSVCQCVSLCRCVCGYMHACRSK